MSNYKQEQIDEEMNSSYGEEEVHCDPEIQDAIQQLKMKKKESQIRRKEDESMDGDEDFLNYFRNDQK